MILRLAVKITKSLDAAIACRVCTSLPQFMSQNFTEYQVQKLRIEIFDIYCDSIKGAFAPQVPSSKLLAYFLITEISFDFQHYMMTGRSNSFPRCTVYIYRQNSFASYTNIKSVYCSVWILTILYVVADHRVLGIV